MRYPLSQAKPEIYEGAFKCRICRATFNSPSDLREHRMTTHKGYMLKIKA